MWSEVKIYLELGFSHILDFSGYDHLLFLVALCALYTLLDWKKVVVLVTAFTVGHSLTLALVVNNLISVNKDWVEFLIPLTIALTALFDLTGMAEKSDQKIKYTLAMGFGLIHGVGFSNYLKAILGDDSVLLPLMSFNIGIELGQLLFVFLLLCLSYVVVEFVKINKIHWSKTLSILALITSIYLMSDRISGLL